MTSSEQSAQQHAKASALHANIEAKKDTSYYYAHKPRDTGDQPAPLPVPELLKVEVTHPPAPVESITTYQFLDDGDCVKVYVPLEGVGALPTDSISSSFDEQAFELCIRDLKPNKVLKLSVRELHGRIKAEECKHRQLASKVVLTLQKQEAGKWYRLKK